MTYNLPALQKTYARQTRIGNLFWLFCAVWVISPYLIDRYRGEPAIVSVLSMSFYNNEPFVDEQTTVKFPNKGTRNNIVYNEAGKIICAKNMTSYWDTNLEISWNLRSFADCAEIPKEPFRACSVFNVFSKSGIERKFGANKGICTDFVTVETGGTSANIY